MRVAWIFILVVMAASLSGCGTPKATHFGLHYNVDVSNESDQFLFFENVKPAGRSTAEILIEPEEYQVTSGGRVYEEPCEPVPILVEFYEAEWVGRWVKGDLWAAKEFQLACHSTGYGLIVHPDGTILCFGPMEIDYPKRSWANPPYDAEPCQE